MRYILMAWWADKCLSSSYVFGLCSFYTIVIWLMRLLVVVGWVCVMIFVFVVILFYRYDWCCYFRYFLKYITLAIFRCLSLFILLLIMIVSYLSFCYFVTFCCLIVILWYDMMMMCFLYFVFIINNNLYLFIDWFIDTFLFN